jgi:acyl-coenzyme A synthetase/AMP-(fatty) acid ligase/3-hydroxymyristoyl/3-hydroxydecanoyl-(acyl carrier protein) dehydratase
VNISRDGISKHGFMVKSLDMLDALTVAGPPCRTVGWRGERPVPYEELLERVLVWRRFLARLSGQRFALYLSDSLEFGSALFGAWQAGKTIFLPGDKLPATCAGLRHSVDGYLGEFEVDWEPLSPPQDTVGDATRLDPLPPEFVGIVLFTSGSTGAAQAIPKKLAQLSSEIRTLERQFGAMMGGADVVATVSHQHIYGLLFKVLWPLTAQRGIHAKSFSFLEEINALPAQRDFVLVSSPAHLKRLPQNLALVSGIGAPRVVFSSGGPLSYDAAQETKRVLGVVPIEVYGSSETGGIAWRKQHVQNHEMWMPMPGVKWRIDVEEGLLEVRSPNLPDENWFRVADRAVAVDDQYFQLLGRIDRIVKIEEKRVSFSVIERQLKTSPLIAEACAIATEGGRQRVAVFIVLSAEGSAKMAEVGKLEFNRIMRDRLSPFVESVGLPRIWRYLDALPVDAQGKTTYSALRDLIRKDVAAPIFPQQRLIERDSQHALLQLTAPSDLLYFDGHFAGVPILAGVVQVDWVIFYGRQYFPLPPAFRSIHALKFQRIIPPEVPFMLELIYEATQSCLIFKITSSAGQHASGRIIFGAEDD